VSPRFLDIGKTNVKVATFGLRWCARVGAHHAQSHGARARPIPMRMSRRSGEFLLGSLAEANKVQWDCGHCPDDRTACAAALIDDSGLVLPVMDYEFAGVEEIEPFYMRRCARRFRKRFSPRLARGA